MPSKVSAAPLRARLSRFRRVKGGWRAAARRAARDTQGEANSNAKRREAPQTQEKEETKAENDSGRAQGEEEGQQAPGAYKVQILNFVHTKVQILNFGVYQVQNLNLVHAKVWLWEQVTKPMSSADMQEMIMKIHAELRTSNIENASLRCVPR